MLWILIRNRLDAQLGISRYRYGFDPGKKRNQLLTGLLFVFVGALLVSYVAAAAWALQKSGSGVYIPMYGYVLSCTICFIFTAIKTNGELFAFKDYEMLSALPIRTSTLLASRVIVLYIWNTAFTMLIMVPMSVVYVFGQSAGVTDIVLLLAGVLLTALLPTVLAVMIGALLTAVSSRFRYYQLVHSALVVVLILMLFISSFALSENPGNIFEADGNVNLAAVGGIARQSAELMMPKLPSARWFQKGIVEHDAGMLAAFAAGSAVIYAAFLLVLSRFYRKINTAVTSRHGGKRYQVKTLKQGGY